MGQRCLIIYSSNTGNTAKVALRFKDTFESAGWKCDLYRVRRTADDVLRPPFNVQEYDFLCAGSGIATHLPYSEMLNLLRGIRLGMDPRVPLQQRGEDLTFIKEPLPESPDPHKDPRVLNMHHKIVLGPQSKKAVVFATYGGYEFGPKEALPALQLMALEIEHFNFQCIGQFCCPGKYLNNPTPRAFHGDIRGRPDEHDLMKAEFFIREKLEEIADRP